MTASLKDIKNFIDKKDFRKATDAIDELLHKTPNRPDVLQLQAKVFILGKKEEYNRANEERKKKIREEAIQYANKITDITKNAKSYKLKGDVLSELDPQDSELREERLKAYQEALQHDTLNEFSDILNKLIKNLENQQGHGPSPPRSPVASFITSISRGEIPLVVQFTDTSLNAPHAWEWNFGDGSESASQHPYHTYQHEGTYTVSLKVTNAQGSNIKKFDACIIATKRTKIDGPVEPKVDSDQIYAMCLNELIKNHPEIIEKILLENEQKLQIKGYLFDAFEGNTPQEFNILLSCIDEMIPFTICKYFHDEVTMKTRLDIRKRALVRRAYSEVFVVWGIESWKKALSPLLDVSAASSETDTRDKGYSF